MRRWITGPTAALLAAGCAAPVPAPAPVESRPLPAVVAALRAVDPCLGDPSGQRTGPHRCTVGGADVVLGQWRDLASLGAETVLDLDGVKAYRLEAGAGSSAFCRIAVPVSPQLAVSVSAGGTCDVADAVARRVPAALVPGASGTAADDRDACTLLSAAIGPRADGLAVEYDRTAFGIDGCAVQRSVPGGFETAYGLDLRYDGLTPVDTPTMVSGRPGNLSDFGDGCTLEWSVGSSGLGDLDLLARVRTPDCTTAGDDAAAVATALAGPAPTTPPHPGPLTYRPDEPDVP